MVVEGKGFAARGQRQSIALWAETCLLQIRAGGNKLAVALHTWAAPVHCDRFAALCGRVIYKKVGAGVIDDTLAVTAWVACVKVLMVRVAAQVTTLCRAAVQIANALVIADKIDALAQPHGSGN